MSAFRMRFAFDEHGDAAKVVGSDELLHESRPQETWDEVVELVLRR